MMTLGLHLTFLRHCQIYVSMHLYGENIENSGFQNALKTNNWNLQCIIKVANTFSYNKKNVPGVIRACSWAIYMYKIS